MSDSYDDYDAGSFKDKLFELQERRMLRGIHPVHIAVYDFLDHAGRFMTVTHGEPLTGMNVVFVDPADLCGCEWCKALVRRVHSRAHINVEVNK